MKIRAIEPKFVEEIPKTLEGGTLYVCCRYRAVAHLCACGCGTVVNTPLHPTQWTLVCDGVSVSLYPSIGSWSEDCRSHYWIRNNRIRWARRLSARKVTRDRQRSHRQSEAYYRRRAGYTHAGTSGRLSEVWRWTGSKLPWLRRQALPRWPNEPCD